MDRNGIFACIDAYTAAFTIVEQDNRLTRFRDDRIPDMYDRNFTLIQPETGFDACVDLIEKELQSRQAEGKAFCQIHLMLPGADFTRMAFSAMPDISQYVICAAPELARVRIAGEKADCVVRRADSMALAQDRTAIELASYGASYGEDFCRRKGERSAEIYLGQSGPDAFVGYVQGQPIGKADLLVHGGWAMVEDFDVVPAMRGKGYGSALLRAILEEAMHRGAKGAFLVTDAEGAAKALYKRLGFAETPGRTSLFFSLA